MSGSRFSLAIFIVPALLGFMAPAAPAAECGEDVAATVDLMQDDSAAKPEGTSGEVKEGSQSSEIKESWQGGAPTQSAAGGGSGKDGKERNHVAFNQEAAGFLKRAARLAEEGKSGGCRQILVQAQRILGIIPADTPLPRTQ